MGPGTGTRTINLPTTSRSQLACRRPNSSLSCGDGSPRSGVIRRDPSGLLSRCAVSRSAAERVVLPDSEFRNTFGGSVVHDSARKHAISDDDAIHAAEHALIAYRQADEEGPIRELRLGSDRAGNLLEVVVLVLDDGRGLIIHAMRMRRGYRALLP
jgi:hypothetical protein